MDIRKFRSTLSQHPIAYMSAEFGLDERLPLYSGGLGILAGDMIREANDMNIPFVGVGLFYREGYFQQVITKDRVQKEEYPAIEVRDAPIELIVQMNGDPVIVRVPIKGEELFVQIWEYLQGDVSVYLLDTDIPQNNNAFRFISRQLYGGNGENRILQQIVLGIGGVRALWKLGIHPSIFHLNESHSAFAILEIVHHYMEEYGLSFEEAYEYSKNKVVFTNHTLVAAGNQLFSASMVEEYLQEYASEVAVPLDRMIQQGVFAGENGDKQMSLTHLALHMSCRVNAVSKLHSQKAKEMWPEYDMPAVTNGVHLPTWVSADIKAQAPGFTVDAVTEMADTDLWRIHHMAKHRLLDEVRFRTGHQLRQDHLIVTWARRFTAYKRPLLLFSDIERLRSLLFHTKQPIQILIAGKSHPKDTIGHELLNNLLETIHDQKLQKHVVFVPNYSLELAQFLVMGSDVWLNTPERGQEACGTSGMKAAANGVLQCSVSDGWMDEVSIDEIGWQIAEKPTDAEVAQGVYDLLEHDIAPLYYQKEKGIPREWVAKMKKSITCTWQQFSAQRMLNEYIDTLYRPTLELESKQKHEHHWRRNYRTRAF